MGGRKQRLQLSFVNVSDGQWHTAAVDRVGQWVTLTLDTGEGRELNESLGDVDGHAELRVSQRGLLAGADVRFPSSNSAPLVSHDFDNGRLFTYLLRSVIFMSVLLLCRSLSPLTFARHLKAHLFG